MSEKLHPNQRFPAISVPRIGGGELRFGPESAVGAYWTLVLVYRGKHCPICTRTLGELDALREDLRALDVEVLAVSADSEARATEHITEIRPSFPVGYGLDVDAMRRLGLYISKPRPQSGIDWPFAEPGLFVLNERGEVLVVDVSNVPFARPDLAGVVRGLRYLRGLDAPVSVSGSFEPQEAA